MTTLRSVRYIAWGLVGVAALGYAVLSLFGESLRASLNQSVTEFTQPKVGGPFALKDTDGKVVSDETLKGKPFAIFFGFTNCPEICPTTMFELSEAFRQMGTETADLTAYFVSVDTERDTPEQLKLYLSSFDPRVQALVGDQGAVDAMVKAYRAFYRKVPLESGGYTIDHTALVYLMGRRGQYVDLIRMNETLDMRVRKLRHVLATR